MRIEKAKKMRLYMAQVVKRALSSTELFDSAISKDKSMIKSALLIMLLSLLMAESKSSVDERARLTT